MRFNSTPDAASDVQEQAVEALIMQAAARGQWAHVTNVHLAKQWMPKLTDIVRHLAESHPNPEFRLWLSVASGEKLPEELLSRCLVVGLERPQVLLPCFRGVSMPGCPDCLMRFCPFLEVMTASSRHK